MRSVIFLMLILGFLAEGCHCSDEKEFEQVCLEESNAWKAFNEFIGDESERGNLFESYFSIREKRLTKQRHLNGVECPKKVNEEPVIVFDAEEARTQLCIREISLETMGKVSNDGFIRKKIKKMVAGNREFLNRLAHGAACGETEVNVPELLDLTVKYKERFYESCRVEETYGYMTHKVKLAIKDFQVDTTPLDEAKAKLKRASRFREEFCVGSTIDCCGDDIVDEARNVAIVETARLLLKMTRGLVRPFEDQFNQERKANDWDDKFAKICLLEHKTGASTGKQNSRGVHERTLKALHGLANKDRTKLGRALGRQSCPADNNEMPPVDGITQKLKVVIGDRCEEEIKPKLICRVLTEAKTNDGEFHRQSLENLQSFWCKKEEKVLKVLAGKNYKPSVCSEQVVAAITENAKMETEILLQLLELERTSERANELSRNIMNGMKNKLRILRHLKKVLKMDITDSLDATTTKLSLEALMLISDELKKLETSDEMKKIRLSSSLALSWHNWFRL